MSSNIELRNINGKQLIYVEGDPFLILSFQLDCDSCYDAGTIDRMMKNAVKMGCTGISLLLYWRLIEPEEGKYDMTIFKVYAGQCGGIWFENCARMVWIL